jgi:hypothetical protein
MLQPAVQAETHSLFVAQRRVAPLHEPHPARQLLLPLQEYGPPVHVVQSATQVEVGTQFWVKPEQAPHPDRQLLLSEQK